MIVQFYRIKFYFGTYFRQHHFLCPFFETVTDDFHQQLQTVSENDFHCWFVLQTIDEKWPDFHHRKIITISLKNGGESDVGENDLCSSDQTPPMPWR